MTKIQELKEFNHAQFVKDASLVLHHLALERTGGFAFFDRWYVNDEPLRNDAARLLKRYGITRAKPPGTRYVGDDE